VSGQDGRVTTPTATGAPTGAVVGGQAAPLPAALRLVLTAGRTWRMSVVGAGLACCAVELLAASLDAPVDGSGVLRLGPAGTDAAADTRDVSVLVVSGTVTDKVAPALVALWESLPEPRRLISFGSCSSSGGPYWDSYSVVRGVGELLPVDVLVPGCPPRPEALLDGLLLLEQQL
jgi:NADH-quinone oxidoreductase subunit B